MRSILKSTKLYQILHQINQFLSILIFKAFSMCHVIIVELIKLKILLDFLFIDIIQYKKYKIIDISQFSFFNQILGPKMGLHDPRSLAFKLNKTFAIKSRSSIKSQCIYGNI